MWATSNELRDSNFLERSPSLRRFNSFSMNYKNLNFH